MPYSLFQLHRRCLSGTKPSHDIATCKLLLHFYDIKKYILHSNFNLALGLIHLGNQLLCVEMTGPCHHLDAGRLPECDCFMLT